jgi:hypothetical protein
MLKCNEGPSLELDRLRREAGRRWGVPWRDVEVGPDGVLLWSTMPLGPGREQLEMELDVPEVL